MKEYIDNEGNLRERKDWDFHHTIARSYANTKGQKKFVAQEGLVLPLFREYHNVGKLALHNNIGLARVPDVRLARVITQTLLHNQDDNVYDRFIEVAEVVQDIAENAADVAFGKDARRLSRNFTAQMPFVLNGQVRHISEASRPMGEAA